MFNTLFRIASVVLAILAVFNYIQYVASEDIKDAVNAIWFAVLWCILLVTDEK